MPYSRFEEFETVVRAWIGAALPAIHRAGAMTKRCDEFWIEQRPGVRARVCRDRFVYEPMADAISMNIPQWRTALEAFDREPAFAPYRGRFVGVGHELIEFAPQRLILGMHPADFTFARPSNLDGADETDFETKMHAIERLVDAQHIETELCTPLWDFELPESIDLEEGLSLEPISDASLEQALQMGMIFGDLPNGRWFTLKSKNRWALYRRYSRPKVIVAARPEINVVDEPNYYDDPDRLLSVLPLVSSGRTRVGGTLRRLKFGWPFGIHTISYSAGSQPGLTDYPPSSRGITTLNHNRSEQLRELWTRQSAIPKPSVIDVGARRLRYAVERDRLDDRLLDLGIAMEALFLPEEDSERELSFRAALNGAIFLTDDERDRLRLFQRLRTAYTARSIVAHGHSLDELRKDGAPVDVPALLSEIEEVVRKTLVRRINSRELRTIDWAQRVLGGIA